MSTLSLPVRLAFGIGQLAEAVKNQGFNVFLLDFIQFPRGAKMGEVESDIVWQLGLIAGPATSVFSMIGVLCYLFYRIDRKRHAAITAALGERQAAMSGSGEGSSPSESAMR